MRHLDRYILGKWTRIFVLTALGFPLIAILIDLTDNPAGAGDALAQVLQTPAATVVVLDDGAAAGRFENFVGGLRQVVLAPGTQPVLQVLDARAGNNPIGPHTFVVAVGITSGQVVDRIQVGEELDAVRIFEAFARAESQ